jgi:hypothetical protein
LHGRCVITVSRRGTLPLTSQNYSECQLLLSRMVKRLNPGDYDGYEQKLGGASQSNCWKVPYGVVYREQSVLRSQAKCFGSGHYEMV